MMNIRLHPGQSAYKFGATLLNVGDDWKFVPSIE
jgi:hypothetical protein